MKTIQRVETATGKLGSAIGRGLIAGLAGTVAITLSQWIEMKINKKEPNFAPADAACKALGIEASQSDQRKKLSNEVHWVYGTLWGVAGGLLSIAGIPKLPAAAIHFGAIFYTALTIQPDFEVSPPVEEWSNKDIAIDALHHAVYIAAASLVFAAIDKDSAK